jgi:hypothetical protein
MASRADSAYRPRSGWSRFLFMTLRLVPGPFQFGTKQIPEITGLYTYTYPYPNR